MSAFFSKAKDVARSVWKVAKDVTGAIAGKEGIVAQAYGKLKSYGSMALGMIFPDMNSDEIRSYQSITSSAAEAGGTDFVENYSKALSSASLKAGLPNNTSITGRIRGAFDWMGSKVENGAQAIYDRTLEFMGQGEKTKIKDSGEWISSKAKETAVATPYKNIPSVQATKSLVNKSASVSGFLTSSDVFDPSAAGGISGFIGKPQTPLTLLSQPLNAQYAAALDAGMDSDIIKKSRDLGVSPFSGIADQLKTKGLIASGIGQEELKKARGLPPIILDQSYKAPTDFVSNKPSLFDKAVSTIKENKGTIMESLATGLGAFAADGSEMSTGGRGTTPAHIGAQRGGLGGQGSSGGTFLSDAQRSFFDKYNKQLSQLG
jgi:hypothetical protein